MTEKNVEIAKVIIREHIKFQEENKAILLKDIYGKMAQQQVNGLSLSDIVEAANELEKDLNP